LRKRHRCGGENLTELFLFGAYSIDIMDAQALQVCLESAWAHQKAGRLEEAAADCLRALSLAPEHPMALHRLGLVAHARGQLDDAERLIGQAVAATPDNPVFLYTLGIVRQEKGRLPDAVIAYRRALELNPGLVQAYVNLGIALRGMGQPEEAARAFAEATARRPDYALAHKHLGAVQLSLGAFEEAVESFRIVAAFTPESPDARCDLGQALADGGKLEEARAHFAAALALDPGHARSMATLAQLLVQMNRAEDAVAAFGRLRAIRRANLATALDAALTLPMVYASKQEMAACRARYTSELERLEQELPGLLAGTPAELLAAAERVNFHLAYQGEDDLELQMRYGRIVSRILDRAVPHLCAGREGPRESGKLRVGFASFFFWRTTVGSYFGSWVRALDKRRFDVYAYHFGRVEDQVTRAIKASAGCYRHLHGPLTKTADRIREDQLDVLIFPELGMNGKVFLLAAMRLARVQCAAWGHPVTSGLATINTFFSCGEMEPADGASHYSERLVMLPGIGTCYARPTLPERKSRASLGLPEGRHLYLFPQSLFKIHPENDRLLAEVLRRDPRGMLIMFESRNHFAQATFRTRLDRVLEEHGIGQDRLVMLPFLSHDDYLRVNMHADVMLDCLNWSGGNTSLDAICAGLPVVTLPGRFMRGRQSQAMLRLAGVPELITADREGYIATAIDVASNASRRRDFSQRMLEGGSNIFDRVEPLTNLASRLEAMGCPR
jgi:protein O-GlcNAc transferase